MDTRIRNEWLAELLAGRRDLITQYWIEAIRAEDIPGYYAITDEQLQKELPPTVDSMIHALQTGDTEGPRKHSVGVIRHRLQYGFLLPDLQMSLHALETAVMRLVNEVDADDTQKYKALQSASTMYYMVALIAAGVYEQLRAEQHDRFITAYEFGISLGRILDLDEVLDVAVRKVAEYIKGESAAILLAGPENDWDEVRAGHNLDAELMEALPNICKSLGCGSVDTASSNMRETTGIIPDVQASDPLKNWSDLLVSRGHLSMVYTPLLAKQRRLGSLIIFWPEVLIASDPELEFLFAVSGHIASAVQNAILYEEAKGKRELGVLLEASRLFASTLDTQDILSKIARIATEAAGADLAVVFTIDHLHEGSSRVAYYAGSRKAGSALRRIIDAVGPGGKGIGLADLGLDFADGKPVVFSAAAGLPDQLRFLAGSAESGLIVPLRQQDAMLGLFALISLESDAFTEDDLVLATGLADVASVAIENALLFEYERNISETLQRSFLPSSLPGVPGHEIAAYYRPAMAEAKIGGDFYDVFATEEGKFSVIIGDVSGKGLNAAVPAAMGKYMVRAYASDDPSPASVITRFNRVFYENTPDNLFMTAFYGVLNTEDNIFTYASAGHDPPLLYSSASGSVTHFPTAGIALGVTPATEYEDHSIQLQPGDVLLLYTDGATDVKNDSGRLGIGGLEQLFASNAHRPAEEIVSGITDGILDYSHGHLSDDVALVVLKRVAGGSNQ